jgi:antirestriction protein
MDADDDLDRWWNNVVVWTGSILEYAYLVVEEDLISEEQLVDYFDYEKFGRDLQASGEFADYVGEDEWFSEYEHLPSHVLAEKWFDLTGKEPTDMDAKTLTAYFDYEGLAQDMEYSGAAEYGKGDYKFVVDSSLR